MKSKTSIALSTAAIAAVALLFAAGPIIGSQQQALAYGGYGGWGWHHGWGWGHGGWWWHRHYWWHPHWWWHRHYWY